MNNPDFIEDIYPLSPMQQGMLFHSLYAPESEVYFEQLSCTLRGELDEEAFSRAWQQTVDRHPALRAGFIHEETDEPAQVIYRQAELALERHDWSNLPAEEQEEKLRAWLASDRARGFVLSRAPLMRLALIRLAQERRRLIWSHHHLILDGWSGATLLGEVFSAYAAMRSGRTVRIDSPRPYRDYIAWLRRQDLSEAENFWRETLRGFKTPTSLNVASTAAGQVGRVVGDENQQLEFSRSESEAIEAFARQRRLTLNTLAQGAWSLLLNRYSGDQDVVFGLTVSGRPASLTGVEKMIGLFINTLPLRVRMEGNPTLIQWLRGIQESTHRLRRYEYSPLAQVQGWSDAPPGEPLFESILVFENYPVDASILQLGGELTLEDLVAFERTNYPLTLMVRPGATLLLSLNYDTSRFDSDAAARILRHLRTLLLEMTCDPERRLDDVQLMTKAERNRLLVEWNRTADAKTNELFVHELVAKQAMYRPDVAAAVMRGGRLSYGELNGKANQLARYLQTLGVKRGTRVGVYMKRSFDLLVGLLGILKAGAAYAPLDPSYPLERLSFMLRDSQAVALLTHRGLENSLPSCEARVVDMEREAGLIERQSVDNLSQEFFPQDLVYVIYTSGSTGEPKGVALSHGALGNLIAWQLRQSSSPPETRTLQFSPLSFDVSFQEIFSTWLSGGTIVMIADELRRDPAELWRLIAEERVERIFLPFVALRHLADFATDQTLADISLRELVTAGEQLLITPSIARLFSKLRNCALYNHYGPTESHVCASYKLKGEPETWPKLPPIGHPIANTQIYLLDKLLRPAPIGATGELYIGGTALAMGYLNRPDLTAERFLPDPFGLAPGARLYRTGDLARYLADGNIEFLGRADFQVKIRGYRVELGEIEAMLAEHPAVRESAVAVDRTEATDQRLVAYVVAESGNSLTLAELRRFLSPWVPEHMLPEALVFMEALPLTPSGKVHRRALPAPCEFQSVNSGVTARPQTITQDLLSVIWAKVLGIESVGIHENFFELGGHSLKATQVINRVRESFQLELPLSRLFESPTIAGLAQVIDQSLSAGGAEISKPIEHSPRNGRLPLSFAQERFWLFDQLMPGSPVNNLPSACRLTGRLDVEALALSLNTVVQRHESLRTTFDVVGGEPSQIIAPSQDVELQVIDLRRLNEAAREVEVKRLIAEDAQRPFDLSRGPLLRASVLRTNEEESILTLTMHHIVSDGWSVGVLTRELMTLYQAFCDGNPSPLPELTIQYADYAVWQKGQAQQEVLSNQLDYWKRRLNGNISEINLPADRPRPATQTFRGDYLPFTLSAPLTKALADLGRREGAPLFMTLLAAFKTLLHRYTGKTDIIVGSPIANRNRAETEELIGVFVNYLILRTDLSGDPSFSELLRRVREVSLGAYVNQDVHFEQVMAELKPQRDPRHAPPIQVAFVLQNAPTPKIAIPGLELTMLEADSRVAQFDLTLSMIERGQSLSGSLIYNADLFDAETIEQMRMRLINLLEAIVADPEDRLSGFRLLSDAETKGLSSSDFPKAKLSQKDFEDLLAELSEYSA
ncbi:MAG: amino acid adenylation domain-containing protein [Acidobacteria bacterium]|nr:amino acid adenylation domain-containing protein [Acidobacteriota bacterium]